MSSLGLSTCILDKILIQVLHSIPHILEFPMSCTNLILIEETIKNLFKWCLHLSRAYKRKWHFYAILIFNFFWKFTFKHPYERLQFHVLLPKHAMAPKQFQGWLTSYVVALFVLGHPQLRTLHARTPPLHYKIGLSLSVRTLRPWNKASQTNATFSQILCDTRCTHYPISIYFLLQKHKWQYFSYYTNDTS